MRWNEDRMEEAVKGQSTLRSYGSALREAVDQLSRRVLGKPLDERYHPPGVYTGKNQIQTINIITSIKMYYKFCSH